MNLWILFLATLPAVATFSLWVAFLVIMPLKAAKDADRLPKEVVPYAAFLLWIGLRMDVIYNLTIAFVFLGAPRELLFTSRLERYKYGHYKAHLRFDGWKPKLVKGEWVPAKKDGWRYRQAVFLCRVFLDPFEVPCHCKDPQN